MRFSFLHKTLTILFLHKVIYNIAKYNNYAK